MITAKYLQETTTEDTTEGIRTTVYKKPQPKTCIQETTTQDRSLHE